MFSISFRRLTFWVVRPLMSNNTLLVKLSSMGDVVHCFPALTEAASHGHRFDWVVEEAFVELAAMHPAVDRILPFGLRRWRKRPVAGLAQLFAFVRELRETRYSNVLDAQGLVKSAFVSRVSGAAVRIGLDGKSAREPASARMYTRALPVSWDLHAIDRLRLLFATALDYSVDLTKAVASPFAIDATQSMQDQQTVLIHGTTWPSKEYPEASWSALIEQLLAAGHSIALLSGSAAEYERAERLCANADAQQNKNTSELSAKVAALPPGSLSAAAEHVLAARLVVGVDSGLTHLAAVLGRPTIGLFGSTSAQRTGVRGPCAVDLVSNFECSPCLQRDCSYKGSDQYLGDVPLVPACFSRVTAEKIMQLAEKLDGAQLESHS